MAPNCSKNYAYHLFLFCTVWHCLVQPMFFKIVSLVMHNNIILQLEKSIKRSQQVSQF